VLDSMYVYFSIVTLDMVQVPVFWMLRGLWKGLFGL